MKILICSDSHGQRYNIKDAFDKERPDAVFFLGDGLRDMDVFAHLPTVAVVCVKGNCDMYCGYEEDEERLINLENKKLLLTHGHNSGVKQGLWKLDLLAREKGAEIILYGHTHQVSRQMIDDRLYICPGSIRQGSYVILNLSGDDVKVEFKELY